MNVTFRQLKLFLAVAETGSVSAAAKAMHVSQPTASMQLREVAQAVGMPLYEVVSRKLYLTDVGQELARTARTMVQSWEAFEQSVDGRKGLSRGRLRVAIVSSAKYFMPRVLGAFCQRYPAIDVALEVLNRDGVVDRLSQNLDDIYIMSQPPAHLDLDDVEFMDNPLVLIASANDPLVRQTLQWEDIAQRRFILREPGSGTRMAVDQHFAQLRFRPHVRMQLGSNEAIKEAVAGGLGLGVVSERALQGMAAQSGLAVLPAPHFPIASRWHVVHPAAKKLSPLAQAFKQHLLREVHSSVASVRPL